MKKFAVYLTKLTIVIFIILFVLDYMFDSLYISAKHPTNKIQSIGQNKNKHFDYIFLGSSRVLYGINESLINKNVFQLGMQGQSFQETLLTLKLLIENEITSDTVFFQLDDDSGIETITVLGSYVFLPFSNRHKIIQDHFYRNGYSKSYFNIPFVKYMKNSHKIGYRQLLNSHFKSNRSTLGYVPLRDKSDYFYPYCFTTEKIILKEKIIMLKNYCDEHDISIIFFSAPYYKTEKSELFLPITQEFDVKNYMVSIPNKELYRDTFHLNDKGANLFTQRLFRDFNLHW